nr:Gfo/Idh/MocA family oxidoreductase [Clostridia bacterium]
CRYADIREAIRRHPADFIVLVIPPQFREEYVDIAIASGLDIVCEKPLADSMEACARICRKVRAAGRKLAVTMSHRMEVEKQTVEQIVRSGQYGKLNYLYSRLDIRHGPYDAIQTPEKYVTECLVHNLDTVRGVSGSNAKSVYAKFWPHADNGSFIGMSGFTMVEMDNGVHAMLEESFANGSSLDGWSDEHLRAECTYATIVADHRAVTVRSDCGLPFPREAQMPHAKGAHWDHALIVRSFIEWIDGGKPPVTDLEDNLQCAALMFAAIQSARTGQPIDVQEYLRVHIGKGRLTTPAEGGMPHGQT